MCVCVCRWADEREYVCVFVCTLVYVGFYLGGTHPGYGSLP